MRDFGFCYVADCDAYIDEAMQSVASLRAHMPDVPIAMVTHRRLFRADTAVTDWVELRETRAGPIVKADARFAPFERVAFLDTDTFIIGDLVHLFGLLDRFDFAAAPEPNGRPDHGLAAGVPEAFIEPNSGVFLFRKSPATVALFDLWLAVFDSLKASRGVTNDQPALRIALWKSDGVRHLTLGSEYNLIPHTNSSVAGRVAVIHDRSPDRGRLAAQVNRHLTPRAIVPGFGPVFGFVTRRGWIRQFARLSREFARLLARPGKVSQQSHPVIWWQAGID